MQTSALLSVLIVFLLPTHTVLAAECTAKSGKQSLALLELYTSEGCSSCPPADQWLSQLKDSADKDSKVVPLAFHVDYWDYLGWKDRFAKTRYSDRQRQINTIGGASFVYTPQATLNGKDFRAWSQTQRFNDALEAAQNKAPRASLSIAMSSMGNDNNKVTVSASTLRNEDAQPTDGYIAIYENNLKSEVQGGENAGKQLRHDFVVRELFGPYPLDAKNSLQAESTSGESAGQVGKQQASQRWQLTLGPEWKKRDIGIAAFVQNRRNGDVLQALKLASCFN